ncbi:hypothetical protein [Streptomyces tremellae]|uniref:Uncharacterized protein n=1 Tax=Streptomyces tremellae TaxID=1124239 RepID=A0ABP7FPG4_9ACTN
MSLHEELAAVRRSLDDLVRTVGRLEQSIARLPRDPLGAPAADRVDLVAIPDTPYDGALWTDSDDEGLGARDRRAP